jgi:hypothetical protein
MYQRKSTRVFQIHELAELITRCTFRRVTAEYLPGRETLAALARVNRMLSEIALRELWMCLDSGNPLVWLLPWDFDALVEPAKASKRMITELGVSILSTTAFVWLTEVYDSYAWPRRGILNGT